MYEASSSSADAVQRASGLGLTFSNPNNLAEQIVLALPFTFALLVVERKWWQRVVLIGFLATNLACLIFTGSRAGMMQLVAVVLAIGWQSKRKLVLFPVLALFLLAVWWATPIEYQHRYATLSTIIEDPESDASAHGRIVGWKVAWQIFQDRPLLGVGAGNFPRAFERFYSYEGSHGWFQPHNLPGQLLGTLGLLGAVAFGIYICVLLSESAAVSHRIRFSPRSPALLDWANRSTRIIVFTLFVGGVANHNLYLLNWYLAGALVVVAKRLTMEKLKANGNGHGKALPGEERATSDYSSSSDWIVNSNSQRSFG